MSETPLDYCPICGRRIYDWDPQGVEMEDGQRWCLEHTSPEYRRWLKEGP